MVETHKQVFFYSADMERNEQYTIENGQWVGIEKNERRTVSEPQFDLLGIQDPKANSDEYFHPVEDDDEDTNNIPFDHMSKQWAWKDGQWVISSQNGTEYEMIDANTLRSTSIIYSESKPDEDEYYYHNETTVITKKRDDSHRSRMPDTRRYTNTATMPPDSSRQRPPRNTPLCATTAAHAPSLPTVRPQAHACCARLRP